MNFPVHNCFVQTSYWAIAPDHSCSSDVTQESFVNLPSSWIAFPLLWPNYLPEATDGWDLVCGYEEISVQHAGKAWWSWWLTPLHLGKQRLGWLLPSKTHHQWLTAASWAPPHKGFTAFKIAPRLRPEPTFKMKCSGERWDSNSIDSSCRVSHFFFS